MSGLKFKTDFQGDIRVLRGQNNSSETALVALREHCQRCYHLTSFAMRYTDDENDTVTIDTVDDLEDAMKLARSKGKTVKIFVVSQDVEEKVAEEETPSAEEPPPPPRKSFIEELRDNAEFRGETIAFIQTLLVTFRGDEQRNLEAAVQTAVDNHPMISQHPDFTTYQAFIMPMVSKVTKESVVATLICAFDPTYVPELFNKVFETIGKGGCCNAFASMLPLLTGLGAAMPLPPFMPSFLGGLFGGHPPPPPPRFDDMPPICKCGTTMEKRVADASYERRKPQAILCDVCDKELTGKAQVLHCSKGKCEAHPSGFDVCFDCACARGHQLCDCGATTQVMLADDCYPSPAVVGVFCDDCGVKCVGKTEIFHCPKEYCDTHQFGADLCLACGTRRNNPFMFPPPPPPPHFGFHHFGHGFGGCPRRRGGGHRGPHRGCPRRRGSEPCANKNNRRKCEKASLSKDEKLQKKRERLQSRLQSVESQLNQVKKEEEQQQQEPTQTQVESAAMEVELDEEQRQPLINVVESVPSRDKSINVSSDETQPLLMHEEEEEPPQVPAIVVEPSAPVIEEPPYMHAEQLVTLAGMGFDEQQAKQALNDANGDLNQAINALLLSQ